MRCFLLVLMLLVSVAVAGYAGETEDLAKKTQNPVSDLISLPFQNNTNFNFGPREKTQNVLNIQPVIPMRLNEQGNLVARTIAPVIYQPETLPGTGSK
ncbi:MAG: hypothetical protein GTO00_01190 [Deltaproteobacteria bacterium]|nr:hypothetical protein [Deltaproteobacteria bacterium]